MNTQTVSAIYFSPTRTTQKVVTAIAEGTGLPVNHYAIRKLQTPPEIPTFTSNDFVILGAPIYVGRVPAVLRGILESLSGQDTPCVLVGVYGNRHFDDFLVELEDIVRSRGFLPVAGAAFLGAHSFTDALAGGRPNAEDLATARQLGRDAIEKWQRGDHTAPILPGNRPYKEPYGGSGNRAPVGPEIGGAQCTHCGICTALCPNGAISADQEVDAARCIKCHACVRACPTKSIAFTDAQFLAHTTHLEDTYADYRPIELFL